MTDILPFLLSSSFILCDQNSSPITCNDQENLLLAELNHFCGEISKKISLQLLKMFIWRIFQFWKHFLHSLLPDHFHWSEKIWSIWMIFATKKPPPHITFVWPLTAGFEAEFSSFGHIFSTPKFRSPYWSIWSLPLIMKNLAAADFDHFCPTICLWTFYSNGWQLFVEENVPVLKHFYNFKVPITLLCDPNLPHLQFSHFWILSLKNMSSIVCEIQKNGGTKMLLASSHHLSLVIFVFHRPFLPLSYGFQSFFYNS